jgi:nucleotide-binding universal stress UspA family protein
MTTLTTSAPVVPATPLTLKDILFTTDFSEGSEHALPYVRVVARAFRSAVHLCHIEHAVPMASHVAAPEIYEAVAKATAEHLTALLNSPALKGLNLNLALGSGRFKDELLKIIRERDIDLIMAGTHGHAGFRKFLLGSVTEEIIRISPCPVMIVGPSAISSGELPFRTILFPTKLNETSEKILPYVILFAKEFRAQVIVLNVTEKELPGGTGNGAVRQSIQQEMTEALEPALAFFKPEFMVESGDPAETVLRVSRERKIDLIAMGIRNRFAPGAHLRLSTAYRIMSGAQCPVLTLR